MVMKYNAHELMERPLVNVDEMAFLLGVKKSWLYQKCRPGADEQIKAIRVGKYLKFKPVETLASLGVEV